MKICPSCSTENPSSSKFCNACGANLDGVEISPDSASFFLSKAKSLWVDSAKVAKDAATVGVKKTKEVVAMGKEKVQNVSKSNETIPGFTASGHVSQVAHEPGSSWDSAAVSKSSNWDNAVNPNDATSVTIECYPFFQDDKEKTIAVIGEKYASSDLEGTYQAPYAVLTQEHLYCKNEMGNFIIKSSDIQASGVVPIKTRSWAFWLAVVWGILNSVNYIFYAGNDGGLVPGILLAAITGRAIFCHLHKSYKNAAIWLCGSFLAFDSSIFMVAENEYRFAMLTLLFPLMAFFAIFAAVYSIDIWKKLQLPVIFIIQCLGGTFSFFVDKYPAQELPGLG